MSGKQKTLKSRKALATKSASYYSWKYGSNTSRSLRAIFRKYSFPAAKEIAEVIKDKGIIVDESRRFLTPEGYAALTSASEDVLAISRSEEVNAIFEGEKTNSNRTKDFVIHLVPRDKVFSPDDPLVRVALDPLLLESVAQYLGMYPQLNSVGAWLNFPTDSDAQASQMWHRDPADVQIIKVFIYLVNVDKNTGPFSYLSQTQPLGAKVPLAAQFEGNKRVVDSDIAKVFPPNEWIECVGPAGTMVLADTIGYHRGGKPTNGNRILITFTYTSGTPFITSHFQMAAKPGWMTDDIQKIALES